MTANTSPRSPMFGQSGLLFLPHRWHRNAVIQWLKRVHAWTGFWGALLFLLMGTSGALLNHRAQLKIDTGEPVEVSAMNVAVAPGTITSEDSLGLWAKRELGMTAEPRKPRGEGGGADKGGPRGERSGNDTPPTARFLGRELPQAEKWTQQFMHPNGRVTIDYVAGSGSVSVKQDAQNIFGTIKNLHKGSGLGIGWVLFLDTIAGALITMSLTGFLLWSRLHGTRLVAGGIVLASSALAVSAVWPALL